MFFWPVLGPCFWLIILENQKKAFNTQYFQKISSVPSSDLKWFLLLTLFDEVSKMLKLEVKNNNFCNQRLMSKVIYLWHVLQILKQSWLNRRTWPQFANDWGRRRKLKVKVIWLHFELSLSATTLEKKSTWKKKTLNNFTFAATTKKLLKINFPRKTYDSFFTEMKNNNRELREFPRELEESLTPLFLDHRWALVATFLYSSIFLNSCHSQNSQTVFNVY